MSCKDCLHIEFSECGETIAMRSLTFMNKDIEVRMKRSAGKEYVFTANADSGGRIAINTAGFPRGFWVEGVTIPVTFYHEGEKLLFQKVNLQEYECVTITLVAQERIGDMPAPPHEYKVKLQGSLTDSVFPFVNIQGSFLQDWCGLQFDPLPGSQMLPPFSSVRNYLLTGLPPAYYDFYLNEGYIGKPGRYRTEAGEWVDFIFNGAPIE